MDTICIIYSIVQIDHPPKYYFCEIKQFGFEMKIPSCNYYSYMVKMHRAS